MLGISIEFGTYSVKFLSYQIDRNKVSLLNTDEILIEHIALEDHQEAHEEHYSKWQQYADIIKQYLDRINVEYQLMINVPGDIVTTRYINLPVPNRKKALLALPFQIEKDLPYSISECHWAESITINPNDSDALVGVVKKDNFLELFNTFKAHEINPKILTCDISYLSNHIAKHAEHYPEHFAIINFGHETTKGYYFSNGKLVSNHRAFVAGSNITEAISKTYNINLEEATLYKHQNSFLLLDDQYDQVNENQKEFAKVMDSSMAPLISEIRRWNIGYRVKYGAGIQQFFICGGTTNIKNFKNYISQKLDVKVSNFDPYQFENDDKIDKDEKHRHKFAQAVALASNSSQKSKMINFLRGEFNLGDMSDLPVHSMVFTSLRLGIVALSVCGYLLTQTIITNSKIEKADKHISILLKKKSQGIITINKSRLNVAIKQKNFTNILKKLNQKEKLIKQEVKVIQSSLGINAFSNLVYVINFLKGHKVELIKFSATEENLIDLIVKAEKLETLYEIEGKLKKDKSQKWMIEYNKPKKTMTIAGKGYE